MLFKVVFTTLACSQKHLGQLLKNINFQGPLLIQRALGFSPDSVGLG